MLAKESLFSAVCQFIELCQTKGALIDLSSLAYWGFIRLFHVVRECHANLCSAKSSADFHGRNARIFRVHFVHFFLTFLRWKFRYRSCLIPYYIRSRSGVVGRVVSWWWQGSGFDSWLYYILIWWKKEKKAFRVKSLINVKIDISYN